MEKLKSRKFWVCVAAMLASIATSIAGITTDNQTIISRNIGLVDRSLVYDNCKGNPVFSMVITCVVTKNNCIIPFTKTLYGFLQSISEGFVFPYEYCRISLWARRKFSMWKNSLDNSGLRNHLGSKSCSLVKTVCRNQIQMNWASTSSSQFQQSLIASDLAFPFICLARDIWCCDTDSARVFGRGTSVCHLCDKMTSITCRLGRSKDENW